jgi:hypothetical protein
MRGLAFQWKSKKSTPESERDVSKPANETTSGLDEASESQADVEVKTIQEGLTAAMVPCVYMYVCMVRTNVILHFIHHPPSSTPKVSTPTVEKLLSLMLSFEETLYLSSTFG